MRVTITTLVFALLVLHTTVSATFISHLGWEEQTTIQTSKDFAASFPCVHDSFPIDTDNESEGKTLYDILAADEKFSILAKLVGEDEVLKEALSKEDASLTIFAPVDEAFKHIKEYPPKEFVHRVILYHILPEALEVKQVARARVLDSSLNVNELNGAPQKLRVTLLRRKVFINYAKIIVADIKASNGVLHAVNQILVPPPDLMTGLFLFPIHFSTMQSALQKVGLKDVIHDTKAITVFTPTNHAFARLGYRTLAYLFSPHGEEYLKRILTYHVSPQLVYSSDLLKSENEGSQYKRPKQGHFELDTLEGSKLYLYTVQYGDRYLRIKINGESRVWFTDGIGKNGVAHIIDKVLIPSNCQMPNLEEFDDFDFDGEFNFSL